MIECTTPCHLGLPLTRSVIVLISCELYLIYARIKKYSACCPGNLHCHTTSTKHIFIYCQIADYKAKVQTITQMPVTMKSKRLRAMPDIFSSTSKHRLQTGVGFKIDCKHGPAHHCWHSTHQDGLRLAHQVCKKESTKAVKPSYFK